jgi:hypothetical protein
MTTPLIVEGADLADEDAMVPKMSPGKPTPVEARFHDGFTLHVPSRGVRLNGERIPPPTFHDHLKL